MNEDLDQKSLLRKYERELKRLREELSNRSRNVVDKVRANPPRLYGSTHVHMQCSGICTLRYEIFSSL